MRQARGVAGVVALAGMLLAPAAWAQQASGIAGVVKDASGAVLPGVTVEAASPALIEKVRTVVTDGEGRYNIVDLRPGTYVVTFSLAGFSTVKREGIELPSGFTATANADMKVGALEETITVTGSSPLVDTQNVRQQRVVSSELLAALPIGGKSVTSILTLTVGASGTADVGGSQGAFGGMQNNSRYHGRANMSRSIDGMSIDNIEGYGNAGYLLHSTLVEEATLATGGVSAEMSTIGINLIPKEGGNAFNVMASGLYANHDLQSNNLNDKIRARGLKSVTTVRYVYDSAVTLGGPIKKDKLWFFAEGRAQGNQNYIASTFYNKTQGTPFYTPDFDRPADQLERTRDAATRVTWQASPKSKFNFFVDYQHNCRCRQEISTISPEAQLYNLWLPTGLYQASWSSPKTSKLLFEAGGSYTVFHWPTDFQPGLGVDASTISILEGRTGFTYNASTGYQKTQVSDRPTMRFSVSYVTGSHAVKVGLQNEWAISHKVSRDGPNVSYTFLDGKPSSLTQRLIPIDLKNMRKADLGLYAQDQWTIKRLSLNLGLRFNYYNSYVPAQHEPATTFTATRDYAPVYDVPNWKDLTPRLGASYDLFGNGRTALKGSLGRYLGRYTVDIASANNPVNASVNSVTRTWNDANGNYVPDCDLRILTANGECLAVNNQNFGGLNVTTRWADDVLHGWGARDGLWDVAAEVQHELRPGVSLNAGYYRNWSNHFRVTDNLEVTPADYSPYCVTAPIDARLPGGGGYQVCGLYDVSLAKFGKVNNLVTQAASFGNQRLVNDFINLGVNTRLASGALLGGGVDTGRTINDTCFVVDSPQQLLNCHLVVPVSAQTQVKVFGSYPLPFGLAVSGTFQNLAGQNILANYTALNSEIAPTLGRNLSACGTRAVCTATATIPLIKPNTLYDNRRSQLDLRLTKKINVGQKSRLMANLDVYNALNANALLNLNNNFGPSWQGPAGGGSGSTGGGTLQGRLVEFSGQLTF